MVLATKQTQAATVAMVIVTDETEMETEEIAETAEAETVVIVEETEEEISAHTKNRFYLRRFFLICRYFFK